MRAPAENYVPQIALKGRRRQAFGIWGALFFIAFVWVSLPVAAPLAAGLGFKEFSSSVYNFFSYLCHQLSDRSFHLDGHPFAVCTRCFGFYAGFLLGVLIYPLVRTLHEVEPLPRFWLFLAMIPMGIDWSLTFFGVWENTGFSRAISGAILGAACAVFIIPALVEINYLSRRRARSDG